ncbi:hypothetical protein F5H01DRAFT_74912 [Linnemannia elongata]|nr:hypothetical protein F5H01DRAFT_74912 [Linnemannia elongata]
MNSSLTGQFLVLMYIRIGINKGTPASFSPFSVPQMFYILPVSVPISLALWPHFDTSSTVSTFIFFKNGQTIHVYFYLYPFYRCCRREVSLYAAMFIFMLISAYPSTSVYFSYLS